MVVAKLVGVFLCIYIFNVQWTVRDYTNSIFTTQTAVELDKLEMVSSYSDLFVLAVISTGVVIQIVRALYLHPNNIQPKLLAKLARRNLLSLVSGSFDIFYHAAVWTIFSWLAAFTIGLNALTGKTNSWLVLIAVLLSISFTIFLLRDVYAQIEIGKKRLGTQLVY